MGIYIYILCIYAYVHIFMGYVRNLVVLIYGACKEHSKVHAEVDTLFQINMEMERGPF